MYQLSANGQFTVVLPEVLDELADRAGVVEGSNFHATLTGGGHLNPAQAQILASVVAPGGDSVVPLRGARYTITPQVGKIINDAARNGDKVKIARC